MLTPDQLKAISTLVAQAEKLTTNLVALGEQARTIGADVRGILQGVNKILTPEVPTPEPTPTPTSTVRVSPTPMPTPGPVNIISLTPMPWPSPDPNMPTPTTEVAPAYDKCSQLWQQAEKEGLFNRSKYGMGIQQGQGQMFQGRMPQEVQNQMERDIRALARSDWGQKWLSDDANAAMIDHRYCFMFRDYWVTRKHPTNPELGYDRHFDFPGSL